jgi:hypothetical protein
LTAFGLGALLDFGEDLEARTGDVDIGEPACIANETKKPRSGAAMTKDHKLIHHRSRAAGPMRRRRVFRTDIIIATLYAARHPDLSMPPMPGGWSQEGRALPRARPAFSPRCLANTLLAKRSLSSDELFLVLLRLGRQRGPHGRCHRSDDRNGRLEHFTVAPARLWRLEGAACVHFAVR